MNDFSESSMVALLPTRTDWCHIDLPHMTLVYSGELSELPEGTFNELAKAASTIAQLAGPITLKVMGVDIFGEEDEVEVFRLGLSPELLAMRKIVEPWNASQYNFNPHVTIGKIGSHQGETPPYLMFDRVYVGWGNENMTFRLQN